METIDHIKNLPNLGNETIHIWGIHLPDVSGQLDALHTVLNEAEQKKAARFHRDSDRESSIAARGALRVLLSGYTGIPAAAIEFRYSETGKPALVSPAFSQLPSRQHAGDTVAFNVSHSGKWVVLAIGRNRCIGVDVETIRRDMDVMTVASRYFTPEEAALIANSDDQHATFFNLWSRKEAYVKAIGSGLFRELNRFAVPIVGNTLPETGEKEGWIYQRLEAGSKHAAAVVTDKPIGEMPCYDFAALSWNA